MMEGSSWFSMICCLFQSIQPTANLDRTDDPVYHNVMTLVEAVLELKNRLSQLPPEDYVVVVKVTDRAGAGQGGNSCPARAWKEDYPAFHVGQPGRLQGNKETLGSPIPGSLGGQTPS